MNIWLGLILFVAGLALFLVTDNNWWIIAGFIALSIMLLIEKHK